MDITELMFDLEPKPRAYYDKMTDAEIEIAIAGGIVERQPDGMLKVTDFGRRKFMAMTPDLMRAAEFSRAAGVTDVREMAEIAYLFSTRNKAELERRYPCQCSRCVAERAGLGRGSVVDGTGSVN